MNRKFGNIFNLQSDHDLEMEIIQLPLLDISVSFSFCIWRWDDFEGLSL